MEFVVGDIIEGKVTGITKFGAFVAIPGEKVGLVHISEVAHGYVKDINDFLKTDDHIKVKIMTMADDKIGLSLKQTLPAPAKEHRDFKNDRPGSRDIRRSSAPSQERKKEPFGFEDMMKQFMQDSNDRQGEVKRNKESRKGFK